MQIDWFTFAAQVINFLILVWLLKRYLYGPILDAIAAREAEIQARLNTAAEREQAAERSRQLFENQQDELKHLRDAMLGEAASDAEKWRQERLRELREELSTARAHWHDSLIRERKRFLSDLRERIARQVQEIARHVLSELAGHELESFLMQRFLEHLDSSEEWRVFRDRHGWQSAHIVLRTAFPLSSELQAEQSRQIAARTGGSVIQFEVDSRLLCGLELVVGDHKLQWNVDHYLDTLEHSIITTLGQDLVEH